MNIYFVASIKGREQYVQYYERIVHSLKELGHKVSENTLQPSEDYVYGLSDKEKVSFYKEVLKTIGKADIVVAEVSYPSLGVGHEVTLALEKGKPVVALYTGHNEPHLLQGLGSEKLVILDYSFDNLTKVLQNALKDASDQMDVRFNFFVSPQIVNFLDYVSKKKKIPRAVYLRRLIEKDMEKNKEYLEV